MMDKKCMFRKPESPKCQEEGFNCLELKMFHPLTERNSKQIWFLCDEHLDKFLKTDGKDWIKWKKEEKNKMSISYVLDFKINYLL